VEEKARMIRNLCVCVCVCVCVCGNVEKVSKEYKKRIQKRTPHSLTLSFTLIHSPTHSHNQNNNDYECRRENQQKIPTRLLARLRRVRVVFTLRASANRRAPEVMMPQLSRINSFRQVLVFNTSAKSRVYYTTHNEVQQCETEKRTLEVHLWNENKH
jgi:hypothetical protein